ncbi:TIGR01777 family protein [Nocardioides mangrovicus]|uniref:TIGR01777 family protein n=1 Tax=Nocardioides mangrovicus TaxID=2478913 RepID=A0A3L8P2B7_9ACTN|nr:TIGR01777 family oxidoreductase [Nocardioides mangrovicus]RLV49117.1 TIGR01777 family protein [Nocardioides mangrovicus]
MRFLLAGSSGFLGTRLRDTLLTSGHEVLRLVRHRPEGPDQREWDPYTAPLDLGHLDGVDVVVNLAGSPTFGNPHSARWREELQRSRVATTRTLAEAIAAAESRPAFLAGNATGWYGDHGEELLEESSDSRGDALLTRVSRAWQRAAQPAVDAGARVVFLRTSPVLDRRSEPLHLQTLLFKAGLGGPLGDGRQYYPCIATADWVGGVLHCAEHDSLAGPVNLTLAEPTTNAGFTRALGRAVHRPTVLRVPAFAIRPLAGGLAPELLGSVRLVPRALLDSGYAFRHPDIDAAVRAGLSA